MTRLFLGLYALIFAGFGAFAFLNPEVLAENFGAADMSANGLYELRSNYGGVSFGAAALCLLGALRARLERPALWFIAAYTGGYALGRLLALPLDGMPSSSLIGYGVFELVSAVLAVALLRRPASDSDSDD